MAGIAISMDSRRGRRSDKDVSRLRFIQRAQKMNFSLAEIKDLLTLRNELTLLVNLCTGSEDGCPHH
ncbi:MAG: MerR family DNA-binding protein [Gammaproteobacteria bacterium]|nr:MerR family DNA-binding protein [Gammaproteobacteria bacterium]